MTSKKKASPRTKKPYRPPTLKSYGNLKELTKGKGGSRNDSAAPKTRMGGPTG
jgi:hypothetical protein